jgi:hypothetical protein
MNIILGIPATKAITFGRIPFPPEKRLAPIERGPALINKANIQRAV